MHMRKTHAFKAVGTEIGNRAGAPRAELEILAHQDDLHIQCIAQDVLHEPLCADLGKGFIESAHIHLLGAGCLEQLQRSEEHTSELQSLMRISYAVFCLTKKKHRIHNTSTVQIYVVQHMH